MLIEFDLIPSLMDLCIYRSKNSAETVFGIFVENGIICSINKNKMKAIV